MSCPAAIDTQRPLQRLGRRMPWFLPLLLVLVAACEASDHTPGWTWTLGDIPAGYRLTPSPTSGSTHYIDVVLFDSAGNQISQQSAQVLAPASISTL
jgi:hypothetical protein